MRTRAILLTASAAGLLLAAGTAQAGICSGEIMALQERLEDRPIMVSNDGTSPGATLGAAPSAEGAPSGETAHAAPNGSGEAATTTGSDPLPDASGGTLVQSGTTPPPAATQPMDSDAATASQLNTAAGIDTTGTDATGIHAAAKALTRARALDQAGDEAACMDAIEEAKSHLAQ